MKKNVNKARPVRFQINGKINAQNLSAVVAFVAGASLIYWSVTQK